MPKARIKGKLPIEIVVRADERHHRSVRKPRTHASPSGLNIEHLSHFPECRLNEAGWPWTLSGARSERHRRFEARSLAEWYVALR